MYLQPSSTIFYRFLKILCIFIWIEVTKKKKGGDREEMKRKSLGSGVEESVSCLWENLQRGWKQIPILDRPTCTSIFSCKRKTFLFNENKRNDSCCPFSLNSPSWEKSLSSSLNLKCRLWQSTLAAGQNIFTNLDVIVICPQRHKKVLTEFRRKKKSWPKKLNLEKQKPSMVSLYVLVIWELWSSLRWSFWRKWGLIEDIKFPLKKRKGKEFSPSSRDHRMSGGGKKKNVEPRSIFSVTNRVRWLEALSEDISRTHWWKVRWCVSQISGHRRHSAAGPVWRLGLIKRDFG